MEIDMEPLINPAMPLPNLAPGAQAIPHQGAQPEIPVGHEPNPPSIGQAINQPIPDQQHVADDPFYKKFARFKMLSLKIILGLLLVYGVLWIIGWILYSSYGYTLNKDVKNDVNQYKCQYYKINPLLCPIFIPVQKTKNGLILIGDPTDIEKSMKYIKGEYLIFNSQDWRTAPDNWDRTKKFIRNTENFRVVILISEQKLEARRAEFLRKLINELDLFEGLQNHLDYIDILVIDRNFKVTIPNNLVSFAKLKQNFLFKKTPHLVANLLFNLKNLSITEQQFFRDIEKAKGLNSSYLSLGNENKLLDIVSVMSKQTDQILARLPTVLKQKIDLKQTATIISLYYSVCNSQKDKILSLTQKLFDPRVILHMSNKILDKRYRTQIKNQIENLRLNFSMGDSQSCSPPDFDRYNCQKEFFIKEMKKRQNKQS